MEKNTNVPKLRFLEFEGEWENEEGDSIFESISNKKHKSDLPILAITQEYGAIPRDLIDYKISVTDKSVESYKVVEKGEYIISLRSFQGGIEYSNYRGICSPAYIILKPKDEIDRSFFKFYFKTDKYIKSLNKNIEGIRDGKMISFKYFSEAKLTFPSIPEQTKIASFLTAADNKLTQLKKKKSLLDEYKKGVMQKIFSQELRFKDDNGEDFPEWEEKRLGEVMIEGKLGGNYENSESNNGIPVIKMGNIGRGDINLNKIQYLPENETYNTNDILKEGDLLFNTRNTLELVGKVAIWRNELPFAIYNSNLMRMKFNDKFESTNKFLNAMFNTKRSIKQLRSYATGTTSVAAIYGRDLVNMNISFPSLPEQTKIANFLSAIDERINHCSKQIERMEEWKKGLLQQMFC